MTEGFFVFVVCQTCLDKPQKQKRNWHLVPSFNLAETLPSRMAAAKHAGLRGVANPVIPTRKKLAKARAFAAAYC